MNITVPLCDCGCIWLKCLNPTYELINFTSDVRLIDDKEHNGDCQWR